MTEDFLCQLVDLFDDETVGRACHDVGSLNCSARRELRKAAALLYCVDCGLSVYSANGFLVKRGLSILPL